jgi:hypothetical protein
MVAEEGIRGLQNFADFSIPYTIEYVGWAPEKPDASFIAHNYGAGNYFIMGQASDIEPVIIPPSYQQPNSQKIIEDIMIQGTPVMRKVYVIFRLTGLPYY